MYDPRKVEVMQTLLNDGSMKNDLPHEMFGVHY
jgi:hypothetical protein